MNAVETLSANLDALMTANPEFDSQYRLGAKAKVPPTTVGRARRGEVAAQVDTVERLAAAFKLRACDLLDPDLKRRLERGEPLRMTELRPPAMSADDWARLTPRTRALIEDVAARVLGGELGDDDIRLLHDTAERLAALKGASRT